MSAFSTEVGCSLLSYFFRFYLFFLILNFSFLSPYNLLPLKLQYGLNCSTRIWTVERIRTVGAESFLSLGLIGLTKPFNQYHQVRGEAWGVGWCLFVLIDKSFFINFLIICFSASSTQYWKKLIVVKENKKAKWKIKLLERKAISSKMYLWQLIFCVNWQGCKTQIYL